VLQSDRRNVLVLHEAKNCSVREAPRYINGRRQIRVAGCAGHARPLSYLGGFEVGERGDSGLGGAHSRLLCTGCDVQRDSMAGAAKHSTTYHRTGDLRSCWHQHVRLARPCRALASLRPQPRGGASRSLPTAPSPASRSTPRSPCAPLCAAPKPACIPVPCLVPPATAAPRSRQSRLQAPRTHTTPGHRAPTSSMDWAACHMRPAPAPGAAR
jgi:hypothetical protein